MIGWHDRIRARRLATALAFHFFHSWLAAGWPQPMAHRLQLQQTRSPGAKDRVCAGVITAWRPCSRAIRRFFCCRVPFAALVRPGSAHSSVGFASFSPVVAHQRRVESVGGIPGVGVPEHWLLVSQPWWPPTQAGRRSDLFVPLLTAVVAGGARESPEPMSRHGALPSHCRRDIL